MKRKQTPTLDQENYSVSKTKTRKTKTKMTTKNLDERFYVYRPN